MILKQNTLTFGVLAAAFAISALYQLYRATLMELPEYDAFTASTAVAYAAFVGVSALVLTDRRWAWGIVSALVFAMLEREGRIIENRRAPMKWAVTLVVVTVVAIAGLVSIPPSTAHAAPHELCSSDPNICAYSGEDVEVYLSTLNQAWASCTVSYTVNWGDGSPIEARTVAPFTDGEEMVHRYARTGSYTIKVTGTVVSPSDEVCSFPQWGFQRSVEVVSSIDITALALKDPTWALQGTNYAITGYRNLQYLSTDNHAYFGGNTRVYGTITIEGQPEDRLQSLVLEVRSGQTVARAQVAPEARNVLFQRFGSDGVVSINNPRLLFNLPSAQANLFDNDTNGAVTLKAVARDQNGASDERTFGAVPRLVRYDGANRYGGRDAGAGGDDWVKPSVRAVASHYAGIRWGDFSNMNGGHFPPHASHQTGNDVDGWYAGYNLRDAAAARRMIGYLNDDIYGSRIRVVWVTYQRTNANPFWRAIRGVTLDDGRAARDVIRPAGDHGTHFHWRISD